MYAIRLFDLANKNTVSYVTESGSIKRFNSRASAEAWLSRQSTVRHGQIVELREA